MEKNLYNIGSKFKTGDKVRIIQYGHRIWFSHDMPKPGFKYPILGVSEHFEVRDMSPELVGQEGIVEKSEVTQGRIQYILQGIKGKSAWYDEKQLELIN